MLVTESDRPEVTPRGRTGGRRGPVADRQTLLLKA